MYGDLLPLNGVAPIPLLKQQLQIGRWGDCDIALDLPGVSAHHCQMSMTKGYWYTRDLRSTNGTIVGGQRLKFGIRKRLDPWMVIGIGRHEFQIRYHPRQWGAFGPPPTDRKLDKELLEILMDRFRFGQSECSSSGSPARDVGDAFRFAAELLEVRSRVMQQLGEEGFQWLSHYSSVDPIHDDYGIEVCGIHQRADATTILRLLTSWFSTWPHRKMYYKDYGREPGWIARVFRDRLRQREQWDFSG
jgi:hypothetical protein